MGKVKGEQEKEGKEGEEQKVEWEIFSSSQLQHTGQSSAVSTCLSPVYTKKNSGLDSFANFAQFR